MAFYPPICLPPTAPVTDLEEFKKRSPSIVFRIADRLCSVGGPIHYLVTQIKYCLQFGHQFLDSFDLGDPIKHVINSVLQ